MIDKSSSNIRKGDENLIENEATRLKTVDIWKGKITEINREISKTVITMIIWWYHQNSLWNSRCTNTIFVYKERWSLLTAICIS